MALVVDGARHVSLTSVVVLPGGASPIGAPA